MTFVKNGNTSPYPMSRIRPNIKRVFILLPETPVVSIAGIEAELREVGIELVVDNGSEDVSLEGIHLVAIACPNPKGLKRISEVGKAAHKIGLNPVFPSIGCIVQTVRMHLGR